MNTFKYETGVHIIRVGQLEFIKCGSKITICCFFFNETLVSILFIPIGMYVYRQLSHHKKVA